MSLGVFLFPTARKRLSECDIFLFFFSSEICVLDCSSDAIDRIVKFLSERISWERSDLSPLRFARTKEPNLSESAARFASIGRCVVRKIRRSRHFRISLLAAKTAS